MSTNVGHATLTIIPSAKGFAGKLRGETDPALAKAGTEGGKRMGSGIMSALGPAVAGIGALFAGAAAGGFLKSAVSEAADLQQSVGAIDVVFGSSASTMHEWSRGAAADVGLTKNEFNTLGTLIGTQLKNGGTAMEELAPKTNELITLGSDLSAMFGGTTAEAVEALSSALKGERDPIERFGVSLNQSKIDAEAAALGFEKVGNSLSDEANQAATLSLIMKQTADAHGTFARESNTLQGQQQRMIAGWNNLKSQIGEAFLPALTAMMAFVNSTVLPGLSRFVTFLRGVNLAETFAPLSGLWATLAAGVTAFTAAWVAGDGQITASGVPGFFQGLAAVVTGALGFADVAIANFREGWDGFASTVGTSTLLGSFAVLGEAARGFWTALAPLGAQLVALVTPLFQVASGFSPLTLLFQAVAPLLPMLAAGLVSLVTGFVQFATALAPVAVTFGQTLVPILSQAASTVLPALLSVVGAVIGLLPQLVPPALALASGFTSVVAAVLPLVATLVSQLAPVFANLAQTIIPVLTQAVSTVAGVIVGLVPTFVSIATTAAGVVSALIPIVSTILSGLIPAVSQLVTGILPPLAAGFLTLAPLVAQLASVVGAVLVPAFRIIAPIVVAVAQALVTNLVGAFQGIVKVITGAVNLVRAVFTGDWAGAWTAAKQIVTGALQAVWNLVQLYFVGRLIGAFRAGMSTLTGLFSGGWAALKATVLTAVTAIRTGAVNGINALSSGALSIMRTLLSGVRTVWAGIRSLIASTVGAIRSSVTGGLSAIRSAWSAAWSAIRAFAATVWAGIRSLIGAAVSGLRSTIGGFMTTVRNVWSSGWNAVKSLVSSAWVGIKSTVSRGVDGVVGFVKGLPGKIKGIFSNASNLISGAGRAIMDGFLGGLRASWEKVTDFVGGIAGWIRDNKGPLPYDRRLLIPAGKAIMGGLVKGLASGMAPLGRQLVTITDQIVDGVERATAAGTERVARAAVGLSPTVKAPAPGSSLSAALSAAQGSGAAPVEINLHGIEGSPDSYADALTFALRRAQRGGRYA